MNIDEFWEIIANGSNSDEPETIIRNELEKLSPDEIASYQSHFDTLHANAYRWSLWGAAYLIGGGCSDDGFTDFRYGLISMGKDVYESALADPDSLASLGPDVEIANEDFGYLAQEVYEEKTENEIPRIEYTAPIEPTGEEWDFDDENENSKRLPRLSKLFS
jgi:hypothetical protein